MYKIYLLFYIACIWILNGCRNDVSVSYQVIHLEGATWASNISASYVSFGSTTESGESGTVSLTVSDGDLLYIANENAFAIYYRFKREDGDLLSIAFDTTETNSARINGSLAFFQINDGSSSWDAFKALTSSEIQALSTLYLSKPVNRAMLDVLRVHEASFHGTGLILENDINGEVLMELLSICNPGWLVMDGDIHLDQIRSENILVSLELLWITNEVHADLNLFQYCTNLESLIITDWGPSRGDLVPLSDLTGLHSLTLADCYLTDLANFEFPSHLERLHLIDCDTLKDISGLKQLTRLNSLSLTGSDNIESLNVVNTLELLKWIGFPENTSQEEFQEFLSNNENLEVVELNHCSGVSDLSQLQYQKQLKTLILNTEHMDIEQLTDLNQLELMVLSNDIFEDTPELISRLRTELPNTEIVPGSGLCLGSGWLLLLFPLVLLAHMFFRKGSRS